jgi:hypothetical protein
MVDPARTVKFAAVPKLGDVAANAETGHAIAMSAVDAMTIETIRVRGDMLTL